MRFTAIRCFAGLAAAAAHGGLTASFDGVASGNFDEGSLYTVWPRGADATQGGMIYQQNAARDLLDDGDDMMDQGSDSEKKSTSRRHHRKTTKTHTSTRTTSTRTSSTSTHTTSTITTTTTTTSTSTTGPHVFGGSLTQHTFYGWLSVWRSKYEIGVWKAGLADPWENMLPKALVGHETRVVESSGGVAGGIVTEGMGYGIMIEGFLAATGNKTALNMSLSLIKSWLAMVNGPSTTVQPLAGGMNMSESATKVGTWPYGVSAVEWSHFKLGPAGVPAWKFPINESFLVGSQGSAADGDQDAIMGMIYTAKALDYPADFVDMVVRTIIAFASADIGFPDLYRTLPGGEKVYIPKLGSMWGGLLAPGGKYKTAQQPWCYSPGYFAPAHYRTFRNFLVKHWKKEFLDYLPPHQDDSATSLQELVEAFDSAIVAGYNMLWYSSCESGTVSNWVGVKAECENEDDLNCAGVPWAHTPYVGKEKGTCSSSGTRFGAFGADASRAAWRIAMDYVLHREESRLMTIYDREGFPDPTISFGAQRFLNRIVEQYWKSSECDGGQPGDCFRNTSSPYRLANAYDIKFNKTGRAERAPASPTTCHGVPNEPEAWWAGFMAYPTFAAFVAPYDEIGAANMASWMDTFSAICNFSKVDFLDFTAGGDPDGAICLTSYFEASQAVMSTLVMSGLMHPIPMSSLEFSEKLAMLSDGRLRTPRSSGCLSPWVLCAFGSFTMLVALTISVTRRRHTAKEEYLRLLAEGSPATSREVADEAA